MKKNPQRPKNKSSLLMRTLYDLRLPLASMKKTLEDLAGREDLSEEVRRQVCTVLQQTSVLHRLAEGVKHYSQEKETAETRSARLTKIRAYAQLFAKHPDKGRRNTFRACIHCNSDSDWQFIALVKKHVEEDMDNPRFNIDALCDKLHMSRTSFYNKLKALTGQAPADYIRLIRLNRAQLLLKEHRYPIAEVAEMTGFSDAKYFREVFKKHFGISPSQYAKDNPQQQAS